MTKTMDDSPSLLEFPCEFPIKVFATTDSNFLETARAIVEGHAGSLSDEQIRCTKSKRARYIAITLTITATSQAQLDAIYRELTAHRDVVMAL